MDYNIDTWKVIDNYFNVHDNYLTKHHLDSFNDFVLNKIPLTIKQYNPQILYKELDKSTEKFKYETHIYYGGKDGNNIYIGKPVIYKDIDGVETKKALYPNEARLRKLTYSSHIFCDIYIEYIIRNEDDEEVTFSKEFKKVQLGQIPIMLQSKICMLNGTTFDLRKNMGECPYDQGGYFVVDGQEKVIVSHERKAENKLYIIKSLEGLYSYSAQIKSVPDDSFKYARTTVVNMNKTTNVITVRLPSIKKQIPLFVLFRALGIESDKEILEYILYNLDDEKSELFMETLRPSIEDVGPIYNQDLAQKYLANLTLGNSASHLKNIINTDIFPHVGSNYIYKAYYLGHVVHKLLNVYFKIDQETDRDSFEYKRVDLSGFLLANLFRESFKQFQRDTKIAIDSEYRFNSSQYEDENYQNIINSDNIKKIFNQNVISSSFNKSFKIGTILNKKGLIQALNRLSFVGSISHLRRINTYGDMIMIGQRKLHPTQYGIICPVETPDGGNIGIKKHLTVTGHITFGCDAEPIIKLLHQLGVRHLENLKPKYIVNNCKVFVNGKWIGIHTEPVKLTKMLKLFRQNSYINIFTSIVLNNRSLELCILTDGGRCCRPLYMMEDNKLLINKTHIKGLESKIDWYNLVGGFHTKKTDYYDCVYNCPTKLDFKNYEQIVDDLTKTRSIIEFIDTDEMTQSLLCTNYNKLKESDRFSHCEIHPSLIMGILGFTIPYVNTSQAPRNVYGTGQTKQTVGVYTSNYRNRFDTSTHLLHYPQKPLITTRLSKYAFIDKLPTGINAIVAIASYSGYNQDDSIIINKSSVERGLFASSYFKTYDGEEIIDTRSNSQDFFYNPNDSVNEDIKKKNEYNYNNVDSNGLVKEGVFVNDNDVLISKYTKAGSGSNKTMNDCSVPVKMDGWGVVDKVFSDYYNSDKQKIARVRICTYRNPRLGDKFASRHGQKGVIGMILPQEDMPFTKDGIVPDIIINPHAIPSRMTLGQLVECVMGKSCAHLGTYADATPFTNIDNNEIFNILENNCKFQRHGDEILYSGINGKQMTTKIFIGPTYYQRLKHMVKDKINSRATGAVSLKTKQPPSGRSVGGGLRIGEMERDAILSHGALQFLKETMLERSDKYSTYVSTYSGMTSIVNPKDNKYICPSVDGPLIFNEDHGVENNNSSCDIVKINIPYNTNLMIQECNAMGIALRFIIDKESNYKKLDIPTKSSKFELQDSDKRKFILSKKDTKKKKQIPATPKNKDKFLNKMIHNKIIVSELPNDITKSDLKKLFGNIGPIFEIRMNEDNTAIIIYTSDDHAKQAISELNNSLLDGIRIVVSLYTNDISKSVVEPLKMYNETVLEPTTRLYGDYEFDFERSEYEKARDEDIRKEKDFYEKIQSPDFESTQTFNFTPEYEPPTSNWKPDYLREYNTNNEPDYSPGTEFELPSETIEDKEYFDKTYGETKLTPIESYVPDDSFMKELERKEQEISSKYKNDTGVNSNEDDNEDNDTIQKGGGNNLNFSEINLDSDNLLDTLDLEGSSTSNLSDLNNLTLNVHDKPLPTQPIISTPKDNATPEIKHITINLNNNPLTSLDPKNVGNDSSTSLDFKPLSDNNESLDTKTIDVNSLVNNNIDIANEPQIDSDTTLNDIPTENLIDNLEISTLDGVI